MGASPRLPPLQLPAQVLDDIITRRSLFARLGNSSGRVGSFTQTLSGLVAKLRHAVWGAVCCENTTCKTFPYRRQKPKERRCPIFTHRHIQRVSSVSLFCKFNDINRGDAARPPRALFTFPNTHEIFIHLFIDGKHPPRRKERPRLTSTAINFVILVIPVINHLPGGSLAYANVCRTFQPFIPTAQAGLHAFDAQVLDSWEFAGGNTAIFALLCFYLGIG